MARGEEEEEEVEEEEEELSSSHTGLPCQPIPLYSWYTPKMPTLRRRWSRPPAAPVSCCELRSMRAHMGCAVHSW